MKKEKSVTDNKNKKEKQQQDPTVERGKKAIAASKEVNREPADVQKKKEREDAEKWRNEG